MKEFKRFIRDGKHGILFTTNINASVEQNTIRKTKRKKKYLWKNDIQTRAFHSMPVSNLYERIEI